MARWTGDGAERRAQMESALSRERSACCHASRGSRMVIEDLGQPIGCCLEISQKVGDWDRVGGEGQSPSRGSASY